MTAHAGLSGYRLLASRHVAAGPVAGLGSSATAALCRASVGRPAVAKWPQSPLRAERLALTVYANALDGTHRTVSLLAQRRPDKLCEAMAHYRRISETLSDPGASDTWAARYRRIEAARSGGRPIYNTELAGMAQHMDGDV